MDARESALIVIGESRVQEQLGEALTRAARPFKKEIDVDSEQFKRNLELDADGGLREITGIQTPAGTTSLPATTITFLVIPSSHLRTRAA